MTVTFYLRVKIEPLQGVDSVGIFGDVIAVESLNSCQKRWGFDDSQEVGIVQALQIKITPKHVHCLLNGTN